ncbi:hypothetical protein GGR57DRAFT_488197 [Xylariaceae sp. FL1272]|nr:hypothetical protein GGR57DRAFT_488197 [Xylariaceae sp. FL1272]
MRLQLTVMFHIALLWEVRIWPISVMLLCSPHTFAICCLDLCLGRCILYLTLSSNLSLSSVGYLIVCMAIDDNPVYNMHHSALPTEIKPKALASGYIVGMKLYNTPSYGVTYSMKKS